MTQGTISATREFVERQFEKAVAKIRRGLDDDDVREFWKTARWAARILSGWTEAEEPPNFAGRGAGPTCAPMHGEAPLTDSAGRCDRPPHARLPAV